MNPPSLITLTTDFGLSDGYVAQMKGAILGINPAACIVDLTHAVPPQDVCAAGLILERTFAAFPNGTVHVAVVDPGVGSPRALVGVEMAGQRFLAPDNGLLSAVACVSPPTRLHRLTEPRFWRSPVSDTFHGRDILAPVAAHWSLGTDLAEFGPPAPADSLQLFPRREPRRTARGVTGAIEAADSFGNLLTNIDESLLPASMRDGCVVEVGRTRIDGIHRFYAQQPEGALLCLISSSGRLEIAVNQGRAADELGLGPGAEVRVRFSE